ncbi:MAG: hypothetical protein JSV28_01320 [Deltaproteobacteria bacterium]|nr:MAG: hypothetical protein JSV28_01320 [Deltaproteobacteria bacterium]
MANRHHFSQNTPSTFPPTIRDAEEVDSLRPQIAISKPGRGGRRKLIYAFNEQGVAKPSRKAVGFHRGKSEPKKQQAVGKKKGAAISRNPLFLLVAGTGFEPTNLMGYETF